MHTRIIDISCSASLLCIKVQLHISLLYFLKIQRCFLFISDSDKLWLWFRDRKKKKKRTAVAATNLKYRDITEATTANMRTTAIGMHTMNTKPGQKRSDHYYGLLICIFFFSDSTAQFIPFSFFSFVCTNRS